MQKSKLNHPWTPRDLKVMRTMAKAGKSARECAKELGRSRGAVAFKAMNEGVRFQSIAQPAGVQKRPRVIRARARAFRRRGTAVHAAA